MSNYSVSQLKELLRARKLSIQGTKADLIDRLEQFDKDIWRVVAEEKLAQGEPSDDEESESEEEVQEEVEIEESGALGKQCNVAKGPH